jgi:hypothetical protein
MREGLSAGWQVLVFLAVLLATFSRCPSLFTHAQFYAEDGRVWYANAYNQGWLHTLLWVNVGYLSLVERLSTGVALLAPLRYAPLAMAFLGTVWQWLPVAILVSPRCRKWAPLPARCLFAALYVAIPNAQEINVVLTNSMWHLALAALLLAFSSAPRSWLGYVVDCVVFPVFALSGPFGILLAPVMLVFWWLRRQGWTLAMLAVTSAGAAVQIGTLMHSGGGRVMGVLGATPQMFVRIVGGDIFAGGMLGRFPFATVAPFGLLALVFVAGVGVYLYCLRAVSLELKLFMIYSVALLLAGLRSPLITGPKPLWDELAGDKFCRYWFFPTVAFLWGASWCAVYARARLFRSYTPYPDEHFPASVQRFQQAPVGERVTIPIVPAPWTMELVKRAP